MSLTSYRAAPPRVKIIRKREARAPPAAGYVATASPVEKGAAPLSPSPRGRATVRRKAERVAPARLTAMWTAGRQATLGADGLHEPADELALGRQNLLPGVGGRQALRTIDFVTGRFAYGRPRQVGVD